MNRRPRRTAALAAAAVSLLVVTGCGAGGPRPGAGVTVDDRVVPMTTVNTAAEGLCEFFTETLVEQGQTVPNSEVRRNAAVLLALRSGVEQLADEVGVEPGPDYQRQLTQLETDVDGLSGDLQDDFLAAYGARPLVTDLVPRIGEAMLVAEGESDPDISAATGRGLAALLELLDGDTEFAPNIGLAFQPVEIGAEVSTGELDEALNAIFVAEDGSASVAVSDAALGGSSPDAGYASSLPASQRCGG